MSELASSDPEAPGAGKVLVTLLPALSLIDVPADSASVAVYLRLVL